MKYYVLFFILFLFGKIPAEALSLSEVDYTKDDSAQVVQWLKDADQVDRNTNWMMFFAKKIMGLPYVAGTLDHNKEQERLVVNLKQLDCTTFVENVTALSLTAKRGSTSFYDFCEALERIRYTQGMRSDYASRNHYFSEWIRSNQYMGLVYDLFEEKKMQSPAKTVLEPLTVKLSYMSRNADKYPLLSDKKIRSRIAEKEKEMSGQKVWYLPKTQMKSGMKELEWLQDGDIVAFVTKKAGLDIAHLGIVCRVNGELRFIHASSLRKKVVLEPLSLISYVQKQPMQTGIRVIRVY